MYQQQLLTVEHVANILAVSKSYVWQQLKDQPDFPKPFKLSAKQTRWKHEEVTAYIQAKSASRH